MSAISTKGANHPVTNHASVLSLTSNSLPLRHVLVPVVPQIDGLIGKRSSGFNSQTAFPACR